VPRPEALAVKWTMDAIELLAFQPLSAPQVASAMQIHPRTARRLLSRLHAEGYLSRSDDGRRLYSPTLRIVSLAGQIAARHRLVELARAVVAPLSERTGTHAELSIPSSGHCTAGGEVLLAWRHAWRDGVLRSPLRAFTQRTTTDPAAVSAETEIVRRRGYASEDDEYRRGRRAAAAPVFLPDGDPIAAVSVTVCEPNRELDQPIPPVVELAAALTRRLETHDA
jgi:DNA-binding IclR family transcriptional regulator